MIDPENRLLWRMNRRRLDFESMRDSLLYASGQLDKTLGGPAVDIVQASATKRSVYGFIDRQNLPNLFRTFDLASPDAHSPQRYQTTVPQQALFLMNSPFVVAQAKKLLERPEIAEQTTDEGKIQRMYRLLYGRAADPEEVSLALRFLKSAPPAARASAAGAPAAGAAEKKLSAWEKYAQVLLISNEFMFID